MKTHWLYLSLPLLAVVPPPSSIPSFHLAGEPIPERVFLPSHQTWNSWDALYETRRNPPVSGSCVCRRLWKFRWRCVHLAGCISYGSWYAAASLSFCRASEIQTKVNKETAILYQMQYKLGWLVHLSWKRYTSEVLFQEGGINVSISKGLYNERLLE